MEPRNNPDAPTTEQLDSFTQALVTGPYFDAAEQYGISGGKATFTGSHGRSSFCIPVQPILRSAEFAGMLAWVTCEVSFTRFRHCPVSWTPISGVPGR
jgi:hypothetical protein